MKLATSAVNSLHPELWRGLSFGCPAPWFMAAPFPLNPILNNSTVNSWNAKPTFGPFGQGGEIEARTLQTPFTSRIKYDYLPTNGVLDAPQTGDTEFTAAGWCRHNRSTSDSESLFFLIHFDNTFSLSLTRYNGFNWYSFILATSVNTGWTENAYYLYPAKRNVWRLFVMRYKNGSLETWADGIRIGTYAATGTILRRNPTHSTSLDIGGGGSVASPGGRDNAIGPQMFWRNRYLGDHEIQLLWKGALPWHSKPDPTIFLSPSLPPEIITEGLILGDDGFARVNAHAHIVDGIILGDRVIEDVNVKVADGIILGDRVEPTTTFSASVIDGFRFTARVIATGDLEVAVSDKLILSDRVLSFLSKSQEIDDGLILGDRIEASGVFSGTVTDGFVFDDEAEHQATFSAEVLDGFTLGSLIDVDAFYSVDLFETLVVGDRIRPFVIDDTYGALEGVILVLPAMESPVQVLPSMEATIMLLLVPGSDSSIILESVTDPESGVDVVDGVGTFTISTCEGIEVTNGPMLTDGSGSNRYVGSVPSVAALVAGQSYRIVIQLDSLAVGASMQWVFFQTANNKGP